MSYPPPPGGHPTSFKTNLNRAKTKRWVEAKSYSYDGDDWGEVDDYDEYGGYDEPPPPPKPTGLRQRGQSATQPVPASRDAASEYHQAPGNSRSGYGNPSGQPVAPQHQTLRSPTNPQPDLKPSIERSNSFDRGDEKRAFSASGHQQGMSSSSSGHFQPPSFQRGQSQPPSVQQGPSQALPSQQGPYQQSFSPHEQYHRPPPEKCLVQNSGLPSTMTSQQQVQSPIQTNPDQAKYQPEIGRPPLHLDSHLGGDFDRRNAEQTHSPASNHRGASSSDQPFHSIPSLRSESITGNDSSLDFHNRRDFSPSAIPPPLQTRSSPSPHGASESQSSSRHPPRKSSLSQQNPPNLSALDQVPQLFPATVPLDESSASSEHEGNDHSSKPLPFVRPADIYKRMHEEKERERRSQDSSRPSMDRLMEPPDEGRSTPIHGSTVPHPSTAALEDGPAHAGVADSVNAISANKSLGPSMDPVVERTGEYGLGGIRVDAQKPDATRGDPSSADFHATPRPVLPDVTRMSGFGDLLLGTTPTGKEQSQPVSQESLAAVSPIDSQVPSEETGLQHQPSSGFRSAVSQAFETVEDQIPATPSSTAGSAIGRSTSGGTSVISPIISRGPSMAKWSGTAMDSEETASTPPVTTKETDGSSSRPLSSSTLGTPKQIGRKPSPSHSPRPGFSEPTSAFIPGHRRNLSTPSPDNSPARTPVLEANRQIHKPQEAELAIVTPIESAHPSILGPQNVKASLSDSSTGTRQFAPGQSTQSSAGQNLTVRDRLITLDASHVDNTGKGSRDNNAFESPATPLENPTYSRAESPGKNRVRDLAGKFEGGSPSRQGSDLSTGLPGANTPRKDIVLQARPLADRLESFRPQLPGGWESYTSTAPSKVSGTQDIFKEAETREQIDLAGAPGNLKGTSSSPAVAKLPDAESPSKASKIVEHPPPKSESAHTPGDALAAVAAAGSALAGALVAAVGMDSAHSPKEPDAGLQREQLKQESPSDPFRTTTQSCVTSKNTIVHPEASRPPIQGFVDDDDSSGAPTPLPNQSAQTAEDVAAVSTNVKPKVTALSDQSKDTSPVIDAADQRPRSMLPPLSTDISSHRYESDRLRREIVKNLSPKGLSEPTTAESESPWLDDSRLSADPDLAAQHDSMAIPREYESYWNGSNSGGEMSRTNSVRDIVQPNLGSTQQHDDESNNTPQPLHSTGGYQNPKAEETTREDNLSSQPDLLQRRYSWDKNSGEVLVQGQESVEPDPRGLKSTPHRIDRLDANQYSKETVDSPNLEPRGTEVTNAGARSLRLVNENPIEYKEPNQQSGISSWSRAQEQSDKNAADQDQESLSGKNVYPLEGEHFPAYPSGALGSEPPPSVLANYSMGDRNIDTQAIEIGSQNTLQPQTENWVPTPETMRPLSEIQSKGSSTLPKMPAFREILALKSEAERIRAFNETREQLANLDSGLSHWLSVTLNELPEHAAVLSSADRAPPAAVVQKPLPFKAKITGLRSAGAQPSQQPYYQQYLNATPQASGSDGIGGHNPPGSVSSQGFSPSGGTSGKLSSQQVQAKGKEFLHSAGVFGGKANVAAKGLFSKGRSKFRGSNSVDKVPNPAPSPEPITRGMQPQRQPQTEQSLPNESSSPTESVRQETHNALPAADALSPEAPDSAKESGNKAIQDQVSQLSRTYEENQLPESENVKNLPLSNDTQPSDVVRPSRQSSIQRNHFISNEENNESIGPNKEIQTPTFGDAAPKSVDATPTTEQSSDSYPEIQRWQSNTPTQADFDKVEQSSTTLASPSPGEHTNIPTAPGSKASYQSSFAVDAGFPGTKSTKNKARYSLIPHSRYSSHNLPSIDVTEETPSDKQDSDIRVSQGFTEDYHSTSYTIGSLKEPKNIPNVQARSGPYPQPSIHPAQQAGVPRPPTSQDSPPAPGPLPHATTRTGADKQRASRPFSFMEYSQSQPTQLTQEHLQREPSIESNISLQTPNRQPSPVSPQRSITRDVSDKHEQTVPTHYDANHDFVSPDNQSGLLRRPRSFSRPFQDPNLQEHPAFRQDGHAREGSDRPTEYYTAQMHHLPRQQTTEYQLEGVGPPSVSRVESKSRSRRSSRSSVFFRNLSTSNKVEGPPSSKDYEGQHAESPANVTAASAKKSKRTSLFRTLTGHNGNERDQNRADLDMRGQTPQTEVPRNLISVSQRNFEKDKVSDGTSSRVPNKLQRASTSVAPEKTVGKKKRFSAIGSLFGRSKHDKSSSPIQPTQSRSQFERPPQPNSHQSDQYPASSHQPQQQYSIDQDQALVRPDFDHHRSTVIRQQSSDYYSSEQDYAHPPQGGYYAPGHSSQTFSNRTIPQTVQTYSKPPEPPAYIQDSSLRQNSASRSPVTSPPGTRGAASMLDNYSNQAQPRQSHWVRNPALHNGQNDYLPNNKNNNNNGYPPNHYGTHSIQNNQTQPYWPPQSTPSRQSYQRAPQNPVTPLPPSSTYSSHYLPPHGSPPNMYNPQGHFPSTHPPRTASPTPPAPPPKDTHLHHDPHFSQPYSSPPPPPPHFTITTAPSRSHGPSPKPPSHNDDSQSSTPTSRHHQSLPPIQTKAIPGRSPRDKNARKSRQMEIERGGNMSASVPKSELRGNEREDRGRYGGDGAQDEVIVMSSTSYPGQEWTPSRFERWDGD